MGPIPGGAPLPRVKGLAAARRLRILGMASLGLIVDIGMRSLSYRTNELGTTREVRFSGPGHVPARHPLQEPPPNATALRRKHLWPNLKRHRRAEGGGSDTR